jgi:serine/threonine protein kinase
VEQPPPSLRKKRPELSKRLERVVRKCLAKHPDDRYRDAGELLADLATVDSTPARATPLGTRAWRAVRSATEHAPWEWVVGAGVLLLALVVLVIRLLR